MQVILTCFQSGDPFGPLTRNKPAALLPVLNIPLLQHQIELCVSEGLNEIHVAVVDHPVAIRQFVGDGARWGANIRVQTFKDPCEATETIARLKDRLRGPIILLPVENCLNIAIAELKAFHNSHDGKLTRLLCSKEVVADPKTESDSPMVADLTFAEPVDSGILIVDSPADSAAAPETMVFGGAWSRVNSPAGLWTANMACLDGRFPVLTAKLRSPMDDGIRIGHHTDLHGSSVLKGPCLIGDFAGIRSEVQVDPYSAIGESVILDKGAQVGSSIILDHTYVGSQTTIKNSVAAGNIILNIRIGSWAAVPDPFLLADVRKKVITPWTFHFLDKSIAISLLILTTPLWLMKGFLRIAAGKPFFARKRAFTWESSSGTDEIYEAKPVDQLYFDNSGGFISRLPGLIDVATGRLALVGVRPLEKIQELTDWEDWTKQRFEAPAGLFTPIDAEGMHDGSDEEKIIAENMYTGQRSFRHNLRVLAKAVNNLIFTRR